MPEPWLLAESLPAEPGAVVELDPAEARHGAAVLRLAPGDPVVLADGRGGLARGTVASAGKGRLAVTVERVERALPPSPGVTLALAVLHTQAMDWAVQKAVETGAERLVPLLTERTQLGRKAASGRLGHWRRIARQALKQCRRPWAMDIAEPTTLDDLAATAPPGFVADAGGRSPFTVPVDAPLTLIVGPEGGLTPAELSRLTAAGHTPLRLGPHTLRAETAATLGTALLTLRLLET